MTRGYAKLTYDKNGPSPFPRAVVSQAQTSRDCS